MNTTESESESTKRPDLAAVLDALEALEEIAGASSRVRHRDAGGELKKAEGEAFAVLREHGR